MLRPVGHRPMGEKLPGHAGLTPVLLHIALHSAARVTAPLPDMLVMLS